MTKKSYLESFHNRQHDALNALRTTTYKAAVAHIYGDALQLQYDCAYGFIRGNTTFGQESAIALSNVCKKILDQSILGFEAYSDELTSCLNQVYDFLNAA